MHKKNQRVPFALDLDPGERLARTGSLLAIVKLLAGVRNADLANLFLQAEIDESVLPTAADAFDQLAPMDMRKVLSTYAGFARPLPPNR